MLLLLLLPHGVPLRQVRLELVDRLGLLAAPEQTHRSGRRHARPDAGISCRREVGKL